MQSVWATLLRRRVRGARAIDERGAADEGHHVGGRAPARQVNVRGGVERLVADDELGAVLGLVMLLGAEGHVSPACSASAARSARARGRPALSAGAARTGGVVVAAAAGAEGHEA